MPLTDTLTPEARLLVGCARVQMDDATAESVAALLQRELDWDDVLRHARRHGTEPLLLKHLSERFAEAVPGDVLNQLREEATARTFRNLQQTEELVRLVGCLEEAEIPVMPFKGPMLAALVYGNPAYRKFVDLDILVHRPDVMKAIALLKAEGYEPWKKLTPEQEKEYIETQLGYEFIHREKRVIVELHWSFFFEIYAFDLDPEAVWERHRQISFGGTTIRTLAPEDMLLYLCTHGTKHRWQKLTWICDVSEFIRAHPELDWAQVYDQAERLGLKRMLLLGLHLVHDLLGRSIPDTMARAVQQSSVVQSMARQVCTDWLFQAPDAEDDSLHFWFHFKERERWRDRIPYTLFHLKLVLAPSEADEAFASLPKSLSFLHYLLRPIRIATEMLSRKQQ